MAFADNKRFYGENKAMMSNTISTVSKLDVPFTRFSAKTSTVHESLLEDFGLPRNRESSANFSYRRVESGEIQRVLVRRVMAESDTNTTFKHLQLDTISAKRPGLPSQKRDIHTSLHGTTYGGG